MTVYYRSELARTYSIVSRSAAEATNSTVLYCLVSSLIIAKYYFKGEETPWDGEPRANRAQSDDTDIVCGAIYQTTVAHRYKYLPAVKSYCHHITACCPYAMAPLCSLK